MGRKWKEILAAALGFLVMLGVGYGVWKITLGFLFRMMDEKYRRIGRGILIGIVVVVVAWFALAYFRDWCSRKAMAEKYRSVTGECTLKELPGKLLRLGRAAMEEGTPGKARDYLEASGKLDIREAAPDLIRCYHALGMDKEAKALVERLVFGEELDGRNCEVGLLAITLGLTDDIKRTMNAVNSMASLNPEEERRESQQLWQEAAARYEQAIQREKQEGLNKELADCDKGIEKARQKEKAGRLAEAVEICAQTIRFVDDRYRPQLKDKLAELAWLAARLSYQQCNYSDVIRYLDLEDCSHYPTAYYLRMLARTMGGRTVSYAYMNEAHELAQRAVRQGIPGAEEVQARLREASVNLLERMIRAEKANLADMEAEERFGAEHGISREEYEERRRQIAAELAQSHREARLRTAAELAEMDFDLRNGGDGSSMDTKFFTGEISASEYYNHEKAKNKIVDRAKR